MKKSIIALCAIAALVATGCRSNRSDANSETGLYQNEGVVFPSLLDDAEGGIPLTGLPFDQTGTRLYDVSVEPIYFGYDSSYLPPAEMTKLERVASILNSNSSYLLIIEGHCDERGSNEYNLSLGEQRALAVRSYIIGAGIAAERIQTRSYGEERPAVPGTGESVWRLNRRGEFLFFK